MAVIRVWLHPRQLEEHPPTEICGENIVVWAGVAVRYGDKVEYVPMITIYDRKKGRALIDVELDEGEVIKLYSKVREMYEELFNRPEDNVGWGE